MCLKRSLTLTILLCLAALLIPGCRTSAVGEDLGDLRGELIIFHAGSLTVPVRNLGEAFQKHHPHVKVHAEAAGSRTTARKVSELGRQADVVLSADYAVIETLLVPEFAAWNVLFARNTMVIIHTDTSRYAGQIHGQNWHEILRRDDVAFGHSDPESDPNGYRTLMVWQLAERYYDQPGLFEALDQASPPGNVRPHATDLIALLETGDLDYAFGYRSVAKQHDLPYVSLPDEINLGAPAHAETYREAEVTLKGGDPDRSVRRRGEPIIYGATIPKNAPHPDLGMAFVKFLLGAEGQNILQDLGQPPLQPPLSPQVDALPTEVRSLVEPLR